MVDDKQLAALIARDIFESLDYGEHHCHRIEGKAIYNGKEIGLGGYAEQPVTTVIERVLARHRSY